MFKYQKFHWLALVVWNIAQGALAYYASPGDVPVNCAFPPFGPPFMQMMDEQASFDGVQNQVPLSTSLLLPGRSNGLMDFFNVGPCPSPGCPPFYGSTTGPFGPMGNRWATSGPMGPNLARENGNLLQRVYGDPTNSFIYGKNSECEDAEQKGKASQYSSKCGTTKKPYCRTRNKIRIA